MRITASHDLGDLARDCAKVATTAKPRMVKVVKKNVTQGTKVMQGIAQRKAGPHGTNYHKRITGEMTGTLSGEFGPTGTVAGNAVGAGWRHGPPNTDLQKAADLQGPRFASDAGKILDGLFWP